MNKNETTLFKMYYDRGDMPITVSFNGADRKIGWKLEPEHIDYHLYLPIFFEGLREVKEPYKFLADRVILLKFANLFLGLLAIDRERRKQIGGCSAPTHHPHQKY